MFVLEFAPKAKFSNIAAFIIIIKHSKHTVPKPSGSFEAAFINSSVTCRLIAILLACACGELVLLFAPPEMKIWP
jgi:hypothetical protein